MSEVEMSEYLSLISEAFISPIRNVVVLDDEYPTYREMLMGPVETDGSSDPTLEAKKRNRETVRKIVEYCHSQKPVPWFVDVHDGSTPSLKTEEELATYLNHSDLLILDYHLRASNGSDAAIEILRRLASSEHFNLVVVYTQERGGLASGIEQTFADIAMSLTCSREVPEVPAGKRIYISGKIEKWSESCPRIFNELLDSIDQHVFQKILEHDKRRYACLQNLPSMASLISLVGSMPANLGLNAERLFEFLLCEKQKEFAPKMSDNFIGRVLTSSGMGGYNWIHAGNLFVTVLSKATERDPSTIPVHLLRALGEWDPAPHRLLLAKMRNEISSRGGSAEADVLKNQHLQAGWLQEILSSDPLYRQTHVKLNVARHWESYGGQINPAVEVFAGKLTTYLANLEDQASIFKRFNSLDMDEEKECVTLHLNVHACSKIIEGQHLSTGHIIRINPGKPESALWLCLTPACDLEPSQGLGRGWRRRLGDWLPFKIVRLFPADKKTALENVTRGNFIFFDEGKGPEAFGFDDGVNSEKGGLPTLTWEQVYSKANGSFDGTKKLVVGFTETNCDGEPQIIMRDGLVVGQLRYEYALSLLQRLGSHLSRVGLDFVPLPKLESPLECAASGVEP